MGSKENGPRAKTQDLTVLRVRKVTQGTRGGEVGAETPGEGRGIGKGIVR